jgi:hypothetical protein
LAFFDRRFRHFVLVPVGDLLLSGAMGGHFGILICGSPSLMDDSIGREW